MGISVVLLAYNEEENLRILLPQIKKNVEITGESYEIIVVDTKVPTDRTKDVCEENGAIYINQEEPYFGGAFRTGIRHASMDKFLILDSDGSHNPDRIPAIHEAFVKGADVVIGSRYIQGAKTNDAISSRVMSKILNTAFHLFLGLKAKDLSTDYRMYHTDSLKQVELHCNNYDVLEEVLLKLKLQKGKLRISEVPIVFNKRIYGESKRKLLPFILSYIKTLCRLTGIRIGHAAANLPVISEMDPSRRELTKNIFLYGIIGVLGAILDFSTFTLFNYFTNSSIPEIANITGAILGFAFNFVLNTFLNFKKTDKLLARFISYSLICVIGMVISTTLIHLLKDYFNLSALKIGCMILVAIIQFILNKLITYRG